MNDVHASTDGGAQSDGRSDGSDDVPLLAVEGLRTEFYSDDGIVRAVDGVSFRLEAGRVLGLVGESGCGKSATCLSVMGLLPSPGGRIAGGSVKLRGRELTGLREAELSKIRGRKIAMIFQDPMTCLNPYMTVTAQLTEVPVLHLGLSQAAARKRAIELLDDVGIPDAARRIDSYPHELSGGMRQRVMIAMALLCDPDILIADEPTTALDVTIQAQILELLSELRAKRGLSIILITHDLGVVSGHCDEVAVMYAGRIVEQAPTRQLFERPAHPYTSALLRSVPRIEQRAQKGLRSIQGLPPRLDRGPFAACTFAPRCQQRQERCTQGEPELRLVEPGRLSRCVLSPSEVL